MEGTKMTLHPVTINLPNKVLHRLQQAATTLQRPLEEMIEQTIQANLPPLIEDLPPSLQAEAASLQQADDQSLWHIVQEALPDEQCDGHTALLSRQREGVLSSDGSLVCGFGCGPATFGESFAAADADEHPLLSQQLAHLSQIL
jgi:hypothetical protein